MPSIITHAVTGLTGGINKNILSHENLPKKFWLLSIILPVIPDFDSIGFAFGVPYGHFFGHRGFFHSLFFALVLAMIAMILFFKEKKLFSKEWWGFLVFFFVITASHGVLDIFTSGGLGIALFSPFDTTRYFAPWRPVMVSPIGFRRFFSEWGARVMLSEMLWIWLPCAFLVGFVKLSRKAKTKN
jgi:inner membrane protein